MAQTQTIDLTRFIDDQKIGAFHVKLVVFSFLLVLCDGYDIGAAAFAGPALVKQWGIDRAALGPLFGAGLFAGLFGPPIMGYLSDRFGRKKVLIGGALFFGMFTLASVWATSIDSLIYLRFAAGLGISGVLAIIVALNTEFAPRRLRSTLFVVMFSGVTFGGGLPGLVAAKFLGSYGWQILFWVGGLVPIAVAILLIFVLPESVKFLALRPERQGELHAVLRRVNPNIAIARDARFTLGGEDNQARFAMKALFAGPLRLITPLFWMTNAINLMIFYFMNQWTPILLSSAGISVEHAAIATALFQFGGTVGGLVIMRPLDKYGFIPVPILFACAIPIMICIGLPGLGETTIMILIAAAGFCLLGLQFGNIASEANVFPTYIRSWGVGSCFAAGRCGSVVGPLVGGILIGIKLPLQTLFLIAAMPLAIGLIAAAILTPLYKARVQHGTAEEPGAAVAPARQLG